MLKQLLPQDVFRAVRVQVAEKFGELVISSLYDNQNAASYREWFRGVLRVGCYTECGMFYCLFGWCGLWIKAGCKYH